MAFRLVLTFIAGLVFGLERQSSHKPMGFATFIFVSIGACALALAAIILVPDNPLPLLSAVVTGIGFLGAGALIKTSDKIFGFTTAASIWVFAIVGLLIGIGEYLLSFIVYAILWFSVVFDRYLEHHGVGLYQRKFVIHTKRMIHENQMRDIFTYCGIGNFKLITTEVDKTKDKVCVTYLVEAKKKSLMKLPRILLDKDWFDSCKFE